MTGLEASHKQVAMHAIQVSPQVQKLLFLLAAADDIDGSDAALFGERNDHPPQHRTGSRLQQPLALWYCHVLHKPICCSNTVNLEQSALHKAGFLHIIPRLVLLIATLVTLKGQ